MARRISSVEDTSSSSLYRSNIDQNSFENIPLGEVADAGLGLDSHDEKPQQRQFPRTATSGIVHRLLVSLTMIAFVGNAAFMVFVFWLTK